MAAYISPLTPRRHSPARITAASSFTLAAVSEGVARARDSGWGTGDASGEFTEGVRSFFMTLVG
ncbi:hypothetical protein AKJ09_03683 [Labilithrix luteola]|uniref:Uncharacterized protein n=1 Tax=Labilithrix luteola TaxID=1391654 RepID=A0A0K1PV62_9BACT|nr:hypothetical protein AKJ09_03683 [Labilithrix luteola]